MKDLNGIITYKGYGLRISRVPYSTEHCCTVETDDDTTVIYATPGFNNRYGAIQAAKKWVDRKIETKKVDERTFSYKGFLLLVVHNESNMDWYTVQVGKRLGTDILFTTKHSPFESGAIALAQDWIDGDLIDGIRPTVTNDKPNSETVVKVNFEGSGVFGLTILHNDESYHVKDIPAPGEIRKIKTPDSKYFEYIVIEGLEQGNFKFSHKAKEIKLTVESSPDPANELAPGEKVRKQLLNSLVKAAFDKDPTFGITQDQADYLRRKYPEHESEIDHVLNQIKQLKK